MATKVTLTCDLCGNDCMEHGGGGHDLQVLFQTEQDEGRATGTYISREKFDVCKRCIMRILNGEAIRVIGAQGYNQYSFTPFYK